MLVDPEDGAAIRSALQKLLQDEALRNDLRQRGLDNIARFRPARVAAQYAALYRRLAQTTTDRRTSDNLSS